MSTELTKPKPGAMTTPSDSKPDWLKSRTAIKGTDELAQYIRPPFVKIVQGSSDKALKEIAPERSVLLVPGNDLIAEPDQKILFTPILFWTEYLCVNPLELKGQMPMVAERSFDRNSHIAKKAFDPAKRNEKMVNPDGSEILVGGKPVYRSYQDTRVFLVVIHEPVAPGRLCAMTFSRAELRAADRIATLISARQADIFACVLEAEVGIHRDSAGKFDWYGFDIDNPSEASPWIMDPVQHAEYERMHDLMSLALKEKRLVVADDEIVPSDEEAMGPPTGEVETGAKF